MLHPNELRSMFVSGLWFVSFCFVFKNQYHNLIVKFLCDETVWVVANPQLAQFIMSEDEQ